MGFAKNIAKNIARKIFIFKNHPENETGGLAPDLFFFSKVSEYPFNQNKIC